MRSLLGWHARVRVLFDETAIATPQRGAGAGDRGRPSPRTCSSSRCSRAASCSPPISSAPCTAPAWRRRSSSSTCRAIATARVSSGKVAILRDVESDVRGRDVLLVDDILESGRTVVFAKDLLMARGAKRVLTAVLLEKPGKRAVSDRRRLRRLHLPGRVRRRLRHGRGAFLSPAALRRRRRSPRRRARTCSAGTVEAMAAHPPRRRRRDRRGFAQARPRARRPEGRAGDRRRRRARSPDERGGRLRAPAHRHPMPIMDGIALGARGEARLSRSSTILLMTGYADQRERARGLDGRSSPTC